MSKTIDICCRRLAQRNKELRRALTLAAELIARPERIAYGAAPIRHAERYGYYIDGEYCGPDLKEALLRATTDTR